MLQAQTIPDTGLKPLAALFAEAVALKTALAGGKLRLAKSDAIAPGAPITLAALVAGEADYNGYTAGGVTIANFNDPYRDDETSYVLSSPLTQFNFVADDPLVTNSILYAFYVDATDVLRGVMVLSETQPMADDTHSIPVVMSFRVGPKEG